MKMKMKLMIAMGMLIFTIGAMTACGSGHRSSTDHQANSETLDSGFDSLLLKARNHETEMNQSETMAQVFEMENRYHGSMMGQSETMEHMMEDMQGCHTEQDWNNHMSMMMSGMGGLRGEMDRHRQAIESCENLEQVMQEEERHNSNMETMLMDMRQHNSEMGESDESSGHCSMMGHGNNESGHGGMM